MEKMGIGGGSWVIIDAHGESTWVEVDKYEIMERVGIHARDLRILDPHLKHPSTIFGREQAIVLNLEHVKAIITANEVLLQNPTNPILAPVIEEITRRLKISNCSDGVEDALAEVDENQEAQDLPFEFCVLEVALEHMCSYLDARVMELELSTYPALDELTSKVSSHNLDRVRKLKNKITGVNARIQKVKDELEQLLGDDGDMAEFFLTRKLLTVSSIKGLYSPTSPTNDFRIANASREKETTISSHASENDIEELEMLLEAYFMRIDTTMNKLTTLREYINDTEDYINIQIDSRRNQLIQLELILASTSVVVSLFSLVTAIFGVNLPYTWNTNHGYMFKYVLLATTGMCIATLSAIMLYARYMGLIGL